MPEGRMLKKAISESKKLGALPSDSARLLYTWLIPWLDVEHRHSADPEIIKGHVFPKVKSMTIRKINKLLLELYNAKLIILYAFDGETYLQFKKSLQKIDKTREAKSTIPPPNMGQLIQTQENSGVTHGNSTQLNESKVNESKVNIKPEKSELDIEFEEFWKFYHTIGNKGDDIGDKQEAKKAYKALRKKEPKGNIVKAANGYGEFLKHKDLKEGFAQKKMYASTFLRSKRWERFSTFKYTPSL